MLGAIAGDIIGSVFEAQPIKTKEFELFSEQSTFTDDTVLTIAVAEVLLTSANYADTYRKYYRSFQDRGYGYGFHRWAGSNEAEPYYSFGNGSAMRVSPVGWAHNSLTAVLAEAQRSAVVSHNHAEGIKGAQAVAAAVYLARTSGSKERIQEFIRQEFGYPLNRRLDEIRPDYCFDVTCQGSVPEAITAFLESEDVEDAIRNAISLGGDSDTMACIAGAIAEAYYREIPELIKNAVYQTLPAALAQTTMDFREKFIAG